MMAHISLTEDSISEGKSQAGFQGAKPPENRLLLSEAWLSFLSRWRWEWIAHLTFREDVHPEAADKVFRVWLSKLNRELFGKRWYKRGQGVVWVRGLERQRRGVIHFHSLLAGVGDARRLTWMDEWNKLAGFARIWPVASQRQAVQYVTKYVVKGGEVDIGGPLVR